VPHLVVVGSTMVDMVAYADRVPAAGETVHGRSFSLGFGGKGANQAVMARRLGASVAMVTCLGDDVFADMTMEHLAAEGVDVTDVRRAPGTSSGVAPIWVEPDGTNRIIVVAGANERLDPEVARAAVVGAPRVDVVLGQFEVPQQVTAAGFAAARARGATTVLNPAPAAAVDADLLAVTDWLVPNEVELGHLARLHGTDDDPSDELLAGLAARLGSRLVVTLGSAGAALVSAGGEVSRVPAPGVDVVDTTGAGDAFVGSFAYALADGWPEADAVRLGCACASASVAGEGTQSSFPDPAAARQIVGRLRAEGG
jgi:ribokinase